MKKIFILVIAFCLMMSTAVVFADNSDEPKVTEILNVESADGSTGTIGYQIEFKTEKEVSQFLSKNHLSQSTASRSYGVYNKSQTFNHIPFSVTIDCSWYANGANSYILNMYGTYNLRNSDYSLRWGPSGTNPTQHTLQLFYSSVGDSGDLYYIAQLAYGGSNVSITQH
ncbi:MAG: hypothetical protein JEZ08_24365 [Clostridiales bacterium]|nr:hypothetical protein [Clostridiales bacterium]